VLPSEAVPPGSYDCHQTQFALHESRAVAAARNVDPELSSNDIAIFGASRLTRFIALYLTDVMNGSIADPQIRPDDVIVYR
jgi:hypothetical protein